MAYCKKCGAYIPIGDTACPACGYDPEEEARQAQEAKAKAEEEERRKKKAEAAAERKRREAEKKAQQEREREEQQRKQWNQDPRQSQSYGGGAAQSQYTSQRTGQGATASQSASQRTGSTPTWAPPWQETQNHGSTAHNSQRVDYDAYHRSRAEDSAAHQGLSVLSYLGPLFLIPLLTRPNDDFARYHANQGLILFLFNGLLTLLTGSTSLAAFGSIFSLYCIFKGINNVLKGKKEPLPLIGKLKLLK